MKSWNPQTIPLARLDLLPTLQPYDSLQPLTLVNRNRRARPARFLAAPALAHATPSAPRVANAP